MDSGSRGWSPQGGPTPAFLSGASPGHPPTPDLLS